MSDFDVRDAIRAVTNHPCPTCHRGPDPSAALRARIAQLLAKMDEQASNYSVAATTKYWRDALAALLTATGEGGPMSDDDVQVGACQRCGMADCVCDPQCTGPFSDAFNCPVHDPRKRVEPPLSGTLSQEMRGYGEAWRKLRAEGHPGGVQPEDLLQWADQVAVLEQERDAANDVLRENQAEFARHMVEWNNMRDELTAERRAHQDDVERLTQERDEARAQLDRHVSWAADLRGRDV